MMRQRIYRGAVLAVGLMLLAVAAVPLAVISGNCRCGVENHELAVGKGQCRMKLRKIWVLPLLLTLVCSVGCGGKADLLHGYEKVVSSMGSLARTSEHKLIGTRTCGSDNYTGAYAATCRQARGKDVVFGGCSLQARRLQVTGSVACQSGFVQLIVKNGSDELWLTPDANGNISQEITGSGGDWYLSVEYADFSGSVTLCSAYAK